MGSNFSTAYRMRSIFLTLMLMVSLTGAKGQSNALYLPFLPECMQMLEPAQVNDREPDLAYVLETATGRCTLYATVNIVRTYNPPKTNGLCSDLAAAETLCDLINGKKRYAYVVHKSDSYSLLVPLGSANSYAKEAASPSFFAGGVKSVTSTAQAVKIADRCHDNQYKTQPQKPVANAPVKTLTVREHEVQSGENLSGIARHYGLTPKALAQWNNIDNPSLIRPGMVLKLYQPNDQTNKSYNKEAPNVVVLPISIPESPDSKPIQHVVKDGETLVYIANHYKISAQLFADYNRMNINDRLRTGQVLLLPLN